MLGNLNVFSNFFLLLKFLSTPQTNLNFFDPTIDFACDKLLFFDLNNLSYKKPIFPRPIIIVFF